MRYRLTVERLEPVTVEELAEQNRRMAWSPPPVYMSHSMDEKSVRVVSIELSEEEFLRVKAAALEAFK